MLLEVVDELTSNLAPSATFRTESTAGFRCNTGII